MSFSNAFHAAVVSWWASSTMYTFQCPSTGCSIARSRISRTSSMPRCDAASISTTSRAAPSAIERAMRVVGSKSALGPPSAFSALARMRAIEVLPVPRGPGEEVCLSYLTRLDRVPKRPDDGVLADDL